MCPMRSTLPAKNESVSTQWHSSCFSRIRKGDFYCMEDKTVCSPARCGSKVHRPNAPAWNDAVPQTYLRPSKLRLEYILPNRPISNLLVFSDQAEQNTVSKGQGSKAGNTNLGVTTRSSRVRPNPTSLLLSRSPLLGTEG